MRRRALGEDRAVTHGDQVRGIAAGLVEVVQHGDDGAPLAIQLGEQFEQFDLVDDIQVGGRLVEQQQRGFLRQHHGDPHALPLAAGERVERSLGQAVDPRGA